MPTTNEVIEYFQNKYKVLTEREAKNIGVNGIQCRFVHRSYTKWARENDETVYNMRTDERENLLAIIERALDVDPVDHDGKEYYAVKPK